MFNSETGMTQNPRTFLSLHSHKTDCDRLFVSLSNLNRLLKVAKQIRLTFSGSLCSCLATLKMELERNAFSIP